MATDINQVSQDLARDMELLRNSVQSTSTSLDQLDRVGKASTKSFDNFVKQVVSNGSAFVSSVYKGGSALEVVAASANTVRDGFAELVRGIPLLGNALAWLTKKAFDVGTEGIKGVNEIFKGYSELSKVGATGARGIEQFYEQASRMGFGIEQINEFTALVQRNAETLAQFGAGVLDGLEKVSKASEEFAKSGFRGELLSMGMNFETINSGIIRYARTMTITGQQAMNRDLSLSAGAKEYILQMDRLTKLTGKSADTQQAEIEAMLQDERLLAAELRSVEEEKRLREEAKRLNDDNLRAKADAIAVEREQRSAFLRVLPAEMRVAMGAMIEGIATDKQMAALIQIVPETVALLQAGNRDLKTLAGTAVPEIEKFLGPGGIGNAAGTVNQFAEVFGTRMAVVNDALMRLRTVLADGVIPTIEKDQTITDKTTVAIGALNDATKILAQTFQEFSTGVMSKVVAAFGELRGKIDALPPYPFRQQRPPGLVPGTEAELVPPGPASPEEQPPPASLEATSQPPPPRPPSALAATPPGQRPGLGSTPMRPGTAATPPRDPLAGLNFGGREAERTGGGAASPTLIAKAREVMKLFGPETVITALNDVFHRERYPNSAHVKGLAMDFALGPAQRPKDAQEAAAMKRTLTELGLINVRDEYFADKTNATTGPHFHAEVSARYGRMTSGPLSGYRATLHGNEVVIPLSNGTTIPLDMTPLIRNLDQNAQVLSEQIARLDDLITISRDSLNVNRKMLSYRS